MIWTPATVTALGPGMPTMPLASLVSLPPLRNARRTASVRLRLIIEKYTPLRRSSGQPIRAPNAAAVSADSGRQTQNGIP